MKIRFIITFFISWISFSVSANELCLNMVSEIESNFNSLKVVPGGISDQIQINKEASGLSRFTFENDVLLMDAERVPLLSQKRKSIKPIQSLEGLKFHGVHIAGKTNQVYHRGIEIFDMSLTVESEEIKDLDGQEQNIVVLQIFSNFNYPYYFKNFVLQATPFERDFLEGPLWILRHQEDRNVRWSHHSFLINSGLVLPESPTLNLYFETDFDNSAEDDGFVLNWVENSTSGPRIDTCVYFLVSE